MPLSPKQAATLDNLNKDNFKSVKMNELSSLINGAFNKDEDKETKELVIRNGVEWFLQNPKTKDVDVSAIKTILISKIKKLSSGDKTTKELRAEARGIYDEIKDSIRSADELGEEQKDDGDDKEPGARASNAAPAPAPAQAAPVGMTAEDYAVMQQMANMRAGGNAEEINDEGGGGGGGLSSLLSKYVDTGSQVYKDNKKQINDVLAIFTEKNIKDGSWLTKIANTEFPGVAVFQEVIKAVGLGFSAEDSADFMKMLSRDPTAAQELDDGRTLELIFKMLINPDEMGKAVNVRMSQAGDDISAWWKKVKGEKRDLTPDEQSTADKIDERRKANEKNRNREKGIDDWFGEDDKKKDDSVPYDPSAPAHAGSADGKIAPGGATGPTQEEIDNMVVVDGNDYDPAALSYEDAFDILMPPGMEDYGYKETTAGQDFGKWAWSFITGGAYRVTDRDDFLAELEREHPAQYAEYQERFAKYKTVVDKAGKDRDGDVDYEVSKDYVDSAQKLTEDLIKKAIASGKLDRDAAGKLYDAWDIFNGIVDGSENMSYADMEELQSRLFKALPREIITGNSDAINEFMTNNADALSANWDGDSDLGNFEWLQNILNPPDSDKYGADGKPKEKQIGRFKPSADQLEVKYRYRGKWGDTDKVFEKLADDVEKRNLVIEVQRLRESIDTTNKLVQSQLLSDRMRFDNTFRMPDAPPSKYYPLPNKFKRDHRAIFTPAVIQNPMRDFERNTRDECYYGQYQGFYPEVMPTSARQDLLTNPLVYPSNADLATGGELQVVGKPTLFDLVKESRF